MVTLLLKIVGSRSPQGWIIRQETGTKYTAISDRREAIHRAVASASSGDVVIIAGKGHETYQIIGNDKFHFDDREVAAEALSKIRER